jgi:DNA-binding response OmpR family regulator
MTQSTRPGVTFGSAADAFVQRSASMAAMNKPTDRAAAPAARAAATVPAAAAATSGPAAAARGRKTVLVVDDERDIAEMICYNLERNGFSAVAAHDGNQALELATKDRPDLIILDIMMPGMDGTEVTRRLKADPRTASIPLVMLTAKGEETDIVVGLTLGADDYVTKPFSVKVLLARLNTVLRRAEAAAGNPAADESNTLRAGPLTIDTSKHEVAVNGEPVKLTLTEFKLLLALVQARGRVLTRDQLMDKAMGTDVFVTDRAIDVHVTAIRKKLGAANWLIHTVRGVGYRLQESAGEGE